MSDNTREEEGYSFIKPVFEDILNTINESSAIIEEMNRMNDMAGHVIDAGERMGAAVSLNEMGEFTLAPENPTIKRLKKENKELEQKNQALKKEIEHLKDQNTRLLMDKVARDFIGE